MPRLRFLLLPLLFSACDRAVPAPASAPAATATAPVITDAAIMKLLAKQLEVAEAELKPTTTLAALHMNDRDFVELIMTVEDVYNIRIPDDRISKDNRTDDVLTRLTLHDFAVIAQSCKDRPSPPKNPAAATLPARSYSIKPRL